MNNANNNKMKTYISIQHEQAQQFELILEEFDFLNNINSIRERDFMTDFIFEGLNEEEETTLEQLKKDLN
tara:strand:+ start:24 stop:233 length:210 start_codon:yes stop_codon:yes gene_type:complete